jgi:hypothetical protein
MEVYIKLAVINLRGVSTNKNYYMFYCNAILQRLIISNLLDISFAFILGTVQAKICQLICSFEP